MPITTAPRSVSDATRFTPTTPHANSKAAEPRFTKPSGKLPPKGNVGNTSRTFTETPEERVARLRAAHLRAREAQAPRFDKMIDRGRRFFDSAHKITVMGLVSVSLIAGLLTVYTAADMIVYNSRRKQEFLAAQKQLEDNSLETARLAYMTGKATEEQIELVEEVLERESAMGRGGSGSLFSRMPGVLGAPKPIDDGTQAAQQSVGQATSGTSQDAQAPAKADKMGLWGWLTSSLKKEEEGDDAMSSQRRLGYESLSEEDDGTGVRDSDLVRAAEGRATLLRDKAHQAFEREKERQRAGGPLDKVGLDESSAPPTEQPKKKGWW